MLEKTSEVDENRKLNSITGTKIRKQYVCEKYNVSESNLEVADFLIMLAEDPVKFEEYQMDPNKVLSAFDFSDDIKSDIVSGKLENIRRHIPAYKDKPPPVVYGLDPIY